MDQNEIEAVFAEWNRDSFGELLFVRQLRDALGDEKAAAALQIVEGICRACWDAPRGCQCWNDE